MKKIRIECEDVNLRLDKFISIKCEDLSRTMIQKLIEDEKIYVNGGVRRILLCKGKWN